MDSVHERSVYVKTIYGSKPNYRLPLSYIYTYFMTEHAKSSVNPPAERRVLTAFR
jgi:hypothetical protein